MNKNIEFVDVKMNDMLIFNTSSPHYLLQSMTNTDTNDVDATVTQIVELVDAGADLVRVTVPGLKETEALRKIKNILTEKNINIPIIADVHFLPEVAEKTATFVEKVRINPGNFTDTHCKGIESNALTYRQAFETMALRAKPLFEICKKHNTVIRVGVNQGSLCNRIITQYGNTTEALVESALEWIKIAEKYDFHNIVFSIKSSHVKTMMDANLLLYNRMKEQGKIYPFHLGVTEAANEMEGRVKSAIGIGGLMLHGLGNTFRVSLTENPANEITFSKLLVEAVKDIQGVIGVKGVSGVNEDIGVEGVNDDREDIGVKEISGVIEDIGVKGVRGVSCVDFVDGVLHINYPEKNIEKWWSGVGALVGKWWLQENIKDIKIENQYFNEIEIKKLQDCILQICGIKKTKTEIIACPSCGRTQFDIQTVLSEVKKQFSNYPHLKIAVMGCVVNGPGEMADADFGIIGSANNKVAVYKKQKRISDFVPIQEALQILNKSINHYDSKSHHNFQTIY